MSRVFISYRRSDSQDVTGRIYDRLIAIPEIGKEGVFRDVQSIASGVDWRVALDQALLGCQVMLVVIGPHWLTAKDERGKARLEDPNDPVRLEIEAGLQRKIRVVPLFASGATPIEPLKLPLSLKALASIQGPGIRSDPDFHPDMDGLVRDLQQWLAEPPPSGPHAEAPPGWLLIDPEFLAGRRQELTPEQRVQYFNGQWPGWEEALSPAIPPRAIVQEVLAHLETPRHKGEVVVVQMLGAGGEGKTTALMQIVCDLAAKSPKWAVLWRDSLEAPLDPAYLLRYARPGTTWLVATDYADLTARNTFDAVRAVREANRINVCFLLCARDTDWLGAQADRLDFKRYALVFPKPMRGLTDAEARRIVAAWRACGPEGMGRLRDETPEAAARLLVEKAKSEWGSDDGSFLGAMLLTRFGDDLKGHVKDLLDRLRARPGPGTVPGQDNLLWAFAHLALPHADGHPILSKEVLAGALGCKPEVIHQQVIGPLGQEAAAGTAGRFLLTRHRAIATTAAGLLTGVYHYDRDYIYVALVRAAVGAIRDGDRVEAMKDWQFLSTAFFERGKDLRRRGDDRRGRDEQDLGIRLARVAAEEDPSDPFFRVHWGSLLRKAEDFEASVRVFRQGKGRPNRTVRPYLYEWATSEGNAGNFALAAWLTGLSLADGVTPEPPDQKRAMWSLEGLAAAFRDLRNKYNVKLFGQARLSVTHLARRLPLDAPAKLHLDRHLKESRGELVTEPTLAVAFELMGHGLRAAWDRREADVAAWVSDPAATFDRLAELIGPDSAP